MKGNEAAFPTLEQGGDLQKWFTSGGLTKREYLAAMAMQGLCVNTGRNGLNTPESIAERSVETADELLKALEQKVSN